MLPNDVILSFFSTSKIFGQYTYVFFAETV